MKKIISFSVYGDRLTYAQGAYENLLLQPSIYPDWICRFYVDDTVPKKIISLLENDAEIIYMPTSDGNYGMWWRFEPLKDTLIERFIVRDTDSRITTREAQIVKEWENSNYEFHIIRDHPCHTNQIMGGTWGATSTFINKIRHTYDNYKKEFFESLSEREEWLEPNRKKYFQMDQKFLIKYIWPLIINTHLAHVKNLITLKHTERDIILQPSSDGSFIGQPFLLD